MEAFIILIFEFFMPIFIGGAMIILEFISLVLSLISGVATGSASRKANAEAAVPAGMPAPEIKTSPGRGSRQTSVLKRLPFKWTKKWTYGVLTAVVLPLTLIVVTDLFFAGKVFSYIFSRVENKTGIAVSFSEYSGSMIGGNLTFENLSVVRSDHPESKMILEVDQARLQYGLIGLLRFKLDRIEVTGLRGKFERVKAAQKDVLRKRKSFEIKQLSLKDIDLEVVDHTHGDQPRVLPVSLDYLESQPLRSRLLWFDLLFRTQARGQVVGSPFQIDTRREDREGGVGWQVQDFPIAAIAPFMPKPVNWMQDGNISINVRDQWSLKKPVEIHTSWELQFDHLNVVVPEGETGITAALMRKFGGMNRVLEVVPIRFELAFSEGQFDGSANLEAAEVWDMVHTAVRQAMINMVKDTATEKAKPALKSGFEKVKGFFNRDPQPVEGEPEPGSKQ